MFRRIKNDIRVVFERDPAARTVWEVFFCYPGLHAILIYRLAHWLWRRDVKFPARLLSFIARFLTGIEIHPGARLGQGFFIDHGMGVVIGETAEVGENVTLYHGVTLGGTSWKQGKRHPTLEDNVVVGAGAKILGPITVGQGARVGSNAVVVKDVPPHTTVVGVPGRVAMGMGAPPGMPGDHPLFAAYGQVEAMPDPVARAVTCAIEQLHQLDRRMQALEQRLADEEPDAELAPDAIEKREEKSEVCSLGDAA